MSSSTWMHTSVTWRRPNVWPSIPWGQNTSRLVLMIRTSECTIAACWCVAASKCHKKPQTGDLRITSNYTNKTLHDFNEAWILFHLSLRIMYNCTFMQMTSIQIQNYVKDLAAFIMITLLQYIFIHLLYYFLFRCLQTCFLCHDIYSWLSPLVKLTVFVSLAVSDLLGPGIGPAQQPQSPLTISPSLTMLSHTS